MPPYLPHIDTPDDLKRIPVDELPLVCDELREFIIDAASRNPGHLGANLGVVELTVALHYVFHTPKDKLIWDVGHQAYAHKILTGRRARFDQNRKYGGISGFPRMAESPYDAFGVGHSSTSISAALGMATSQKLKQKGEEKIVAVIGDGSLAAGMAFEALNHAGSLKSDMLVIVNDNDMAIDPNVGAMREYLLSITTSRVYNRVKTNVWNMMEGIARIRRLLQRMENGIKSTLLRQSNLFESLNFRYFGPVDGHDVRNLIKVLSDLKNIEGPKLLHVVTVKGKGYKFAEDDQSLWHAPGTFDVPTGKICSTEGCEKLPPKLQDVFGMTLTELAAGNLRIVGITPAMARGCGMIHMQHAFPERTFDVGIAEQHAVTFAAGLAAEGMIPYCNIYSSFLQRAYDQVIHDVALQNLPVVLCLDRAGLTGEDGATHHGAYDLAFLRCIPGLTISAPMDSDELRSLMFTAQAQPAGPFVIRYPKGHASCCQWQTPMHLLEIGKGRMLRDGSDLAILSLGSAGQMAAKACEELALRGIHTAHFDMRFLKPLDEELLHQACSRFPKLITIEDGAIQGGLGSAVLEFINEHHYPVRLSRLGIPDRFVQQGSQEELFRECGYDVPGILKAAEKLLSSKEGI